MSSALSNSEQRLRPSLDDAKLKLDCKVVLEPLPKEYLNNGNAHAKVPTKKRLNGKKRNPLYGLDSDSGEDESVNHHAKNSLPSVKSKGKALKKTVHLDEPTSSLQYSSDDSVAFISDADSACKVTKSKFVVEKLSNSKEARAERRLSSHNGRSSMAPTSVNLVDEDSDDCAVPKSDIARGKRDLRYSESDEDVIILSSGDEETFSSQPRFKQEPLDADDHSTKSSLVNGHVSSSSSDEDSPFFPELSQPFLKEIEEEDEEETNLSRKISRKGFDVDKLNSLVKSGRFSQKGKTTIPTEPKTLHAPPKGRFSLATGSSSRRETDNEAAEDFQRKKISKAGPRTSIMISPKPTPSRKRKSANGVCSVREKLCKEQGMEGYTASVKALKKKAKDGSCNERTSSDRPSTSGNKASDPPQKFLTPRPSAQVPKERKSSAPIPVKVLSVNYSRSKLQYFHNNIFCLGQSNQEIPCRFICKRLRW